MSSTAQVSMNQRTDSLGTQVIRNTTVFLKAKIAIITPDDFLLYSDENLNTQS